MDNLADKTPTRADTLFPKLGEVKKLAAVLEFSKTALIQY
jgi:hypothetical protein